MKHSEQLTCQNCGSNDYATRQVNQHLGAYCNSCNQWIKWIPQDKPKIHFGKFKGKYVTDIEDILYLKWMKDKIKMTATLRKAVEEQISELQFRFK